MLLVTSTSLHTSPRLLIPRGQSSILTTDLSHAPLKERNMSEHVLLRIIRPMAFSTMRSFSHHCRSISYYLSRCPFATKVSGKLLLYLTIVRVILLCLYSTIPRVYCCIQEYIIMVYIYCSVVYQCQQYVMPSSMMI